MVNRGKDFTKMINHDKNASASAQAQQPEEQALNHLPSYTAVNIQTDL